MSTQAKDVSTRALLLKSWSNTIAQADIENIARVSAASMAGWLLLSEDGDVWLALAKVPTGGKYWTAVRERLEPFAMKNRR